MKRIKEVTFLRAMLGIFTWPAHFSETFVSRRVEVIFKGVCCESWIFYHFEKSDIQLLHFISLCAPSLFACFTSQYNIYVNISCQRSGYRTYSAILYRTVRTYICYSATNSLELNNSNTEPDFATHYRMPFHFGSYRVFTLTPSSRNSLKVIHCMCCPLLPNRDRLLFISLTTFALPVFLFIHLLD